MQAEARPGGIPRPSAVFWTVNLSALFFICLIFLIAQISKRSGKSTPGVSAGQLDPAFCEGEKLYKARDFVAAMPLLQRVAQAGDALASRG